MLVYCYAGEVVKGVWLHMYYACVLLYRRGSEGGVASHVLCLCIAIQRGSEGGVALSLLVSVSQHQTGSTGYFFLMYLLHNAWYTHTHIHTHVHTAASYRSIKTLLLNSAQTKVFSVSWLQT